MTNKRHDKLHDDWFTLSYYRWKALIRSKEYKEFYSRVESRLDDESALEQETASRRRSYAAVDYDEYGFPISAYVPGLDEIAQEGGDCDNLLAARQTLQSEEAELWSEARKRFGLMVLSFEDLEPIDYAEDESRPLIMFTDYLPAAPGVNDRRLFEGAVVKEMTKYDLLQIKVILNRASSNKKVFVIDTEYPPEIIVSALASRLGLVPTEGRKDRKDYSKWDEAFRVWDIQQETNNLYETARRMGWEDKTDRSGVEYTKEGLRDLVNKKYKVADDLINLAGQGKFKTL